MNTDNDRTLVTLYRETLEEAEISQNLAEKLASAEKMSNMPVEADKNTADLRAQNESTPVRMKRLTKRIGLVAAAFAGAFLLSNVITYAATGTAWVERLWADSYEDMLDATTQGGTLEGTIYKAVPFVNRSGGIEYHQVAYGTDETGLKRSYTGMAFSDIDGKSVELDADLIATEVDPAVIGEVSAKEIVNTFDVSPYMDAEAIAKNSDISEDGILTVVTAEAFVDGVQIEKIYSSSTMDGLGYSIFECERDSAQYLIVVCFRDGRPEIRAFIGEPVKVGQGELSH